MKPVSELSVKIFADGADLKGISNLSRNPLIKGFTTNPTLMRKAGIQDYRGFAREVLGIIGERPVSFEVFAGRVADTGRDPAPLMAEAVQLLKANPKAELIWASPRELLNIFHADAVGCHIITVTHDILNKLSLVGKDLAEYSLDTVRMFYQDARSA